MRISVFSPKFDSSPLLNFKENIESIPTFVAVPAVINSLNFKENIESFIALIILALFESFFGISKRILKGVSSGLVVAVVLLNFKENIESVITYSCA